MVNSRRRLGNSYEFFIRAVGSFMMDGFDCWISCKQEDLGGFIQTAINMKILLNQSRHHQTSRFNLGWISMDVRHPAELRLQCDSCFTWRWHFTWHPDGDIYCRLSRWQLAVRLFLMRFPPISASGDGFYNIGGWLQFCLFHFPYAPCMEYSPTCALTITQFCR